MLCKLQVFSTFQKCLHHYRMRKHYLYVKLCKLTEPDTIICFCATMHSYIHLFKIKFNLFSGRRIFSGAFKTLVPLTNAILSVSHAYLHQLRHWPDQRCAEVPNLQEENNHLIYYYYLYCLVSLHHPGLAPGQF